MLAGRVLALMPICAWYASCQRHATKPFLAKPVPLQFAAYLVYTNILSHPPKNGKERISFHPILWGGFPCDLRYDSSGALRMAASSWYSRVDPRGQPWEWGARPWNLI